MTFINKMDLAEAAIRTNSSREIEQTLGMTAVPFNWPIGEGSGFQGLYDLQGTPQVLFFQPGRCTNQRPGADEGGRPSPTRA